MLKIHPVAELPKFVLQFSTRTVQCVQSFFSLSINKMISENNVFALKYIVKSIQKFFFVIKSEILYKTPNIRKSHLLTFFVILKNVN